MATDSDKLPVHIGIIMDGNGRWAQSRGLPRAAGHKEGAEVFNRITKHCRKIGIKYVTYYAFSTENWKRPADEVNALMKLFEQYLGTAEQYSKDNVRLMFIGDKSRFPEKLRLKMEELEKKSENFDAMTVIMAMNYGGRDDIVRAAARAAALVRDRSITPEQIDESLISSLIYTGGIPDPDMIIRPGGEKRLSNFLTWQSAYSELYFTDVLWPDFTAKELDKALEEFAHRGRRFGGV